jgi:hypothetical protein
MYSLRWRHAESQNRYNVGFQAKTRSRNPGVCQFQDVSGSCKFHSRTNKETSTLVSPQTGKVTRAKINFGGFGVNQDLAELS